MPKKQPKKTYILYDARARLDITDNAAILLAQDEKPKHNTKEYGDGTIWAEYDIGPDGKTLINERLMWELK